MNVSDVASSTEKKKKLQTMYRWFDESSNQINSRKQRRLERKSETKGRSYLYFVENFDSN